MPCYKASGFLQYRNSSSEYLLQSIVWSCKSFEKVWVPNRVEHNISLHVVGSSLQSSSTRKPWILQLLDAVSFNTNYEFVLCCDIILLQKDTNNAITSYLQNQTQLPAYTPLFWLGLSSDELSSSVADVRLTGDPFQQDRISGAFSRNACPVFRNATLSPISSQYPVLGSSFKKRPGGSDCRTAQTIFAAMCVFSSFFVWWDR